MFRHRGGPLVSRTLAGPGKALWLYLVVVTWSFQYVEGELKGKLIKVMFNINQIKDVKIGKDVIYRHDFKEVQD